ncbi:glycosyltransferase family 4 protein [Jeotgalibaca caeni]|uniref:glycosyltransferase family 4 protein n=1 Tax=Jeotgalibaca caeni TaxID=3028623 RepID=UPI00237E890E|nr:glycosyltransferase family 4 protein [Jeotgalibaca caeni]MDE1549879.1 glycosyltransferase family 4 protein [Jeotgalibaca caeni]
MNIAIVTTSYPSTLTPTKHVFLQKLVWTFADLGHNCVVISPVDKKNTLLKELPTETDELSPNNNLIKIYYPRYTNLGFRKRFGINLQKMSLNNFTNSVYRAVEKSPLKFDVIYSHFLTPAGMAASRIGKKLSIPAFVAFGESDTWSIEGFGIKNIIEELKNITGFIAVSTENKRRLIKLGIASEEKIKVFPNGVDLTKFYKTDKKEARKYFGFSQQDFIVAFVGQFNERKGVLRVVNALENEEGVKVAFAGKGPLQPFTKNSVYNDIVNPDDMPKFLNAADIFLLPTLNEGCCNAIIEAMACGLPIVSSNLPFNEDLLEANNSIGINPQDEQEIKNAVLTLKNNPSLLKEYSEGALEKASQLDINIRATNISDWIKAIQ